MDETKIIESGQEIFLGKLPTDGTEDTWSKMSYNKFINTIYRFGFKVGYKQHLSSKTDQKEFVFYYPEKGLILYAFFDDSDKLTLLHLYGEVKAEISEKKMQILFKNDSVGAYKKIGKEIHVFFSIEDASKNLVSYLENLYKSFSSCKIWSKWPIDSYLNFLTPYQRDNGENIKEITAKKIYLSSIGVKEIINI